MNPHRIIIYTDGSCDTQHAVGAWAAILFVQGTKIVLQGEAENTTNNRMELMAVIEAIEYVDTHYPDTTMEIYTDSQYVVRLPERQEKLLANNFHTKKGTPIQNYDLVQILLQKLENTKVALSKVAAHQGKCVSEITKFNTEVDRICRKHVREFVKENYKGISD